LGENRWRRRQEEGSGAREAGEEEEELKKRGIRAKKEHRRAVERNKRSTHALWAPLSTHSQQARDMFSQGRKIKVELEETWV
jgi:hypothetical protein